VCTLAQGIAIDHCTGRMVSGGIISSPPNYIVQATDCEDGQWQWRWGKMVSEWGWGKDDQLGWGKDGQLGWGKIVSGGVVWLCW
jgi:hypothetical protein